MAVGPAALALRGGLAGWAVAAGSAWAVWLGPGSWLAWAWLDFRAGLVWALGLFNHELREIYHECLVP